jgi:predicted peptidase
LRRKDMRFRAVAVVVSVVLAGLFVAVGASAGMEKKKAEAGGQVPQELKKTVTKELTLDYLLYLPAEYGKKEQKWPVILFLHGAGERGDDLEKVKVHGPPKLVEAGKDFEFIIVSPQCPEGRWWPEKLDELKALLDEVEAGYEVDTHRIYLTGLSMGGFGSWSLACDSPERFAAVAPICGGGQWFLGRRLKDVPVWAFHGAKDPVVPLRLSQEMVDAINEAGGSAKLTVYPEAGHDSWTETYDNPELYKWFLEHRIGEKEED